MPGQRKRYDAAFKAKVAIEAIKGQRTVNEIASAYQIHPHQVTEWKKQALQQMPEIFSNGRARAQFDDEELRNQLYQEIGRLKIEIEWLKKNLDLVVEDCRSWIDPNQSEITIARQCDLLGLARSSYYYHPQEETAENPPIQCSKILMLSFGELGVWSVVNIKPVIRRSDIGWDIGWRRRIQSEVSLFDLARPRPQPSFRD